VFFIPLQEALWAPTLPLGVAPHAGHRQQVIDNPERAVPYVFDAS